MTCTDVKCESACHVHVVNVSRHYVTLWNLQVYVALVSRHYGR